MAKDEKPIFRRCAKCKTLKEKKQFPGAFQAAKKFENCCGECIRGYVDSLIHPVDRGVYVGPPRLAPNLDPNRRNCTLCDWDPKLSRRHRLCSACVTALLTATVESKLRLFENLYAEAQTRGKEHVKRFEWLNRAFGPPEDLMEEVREEQKAIHKNYYTNERGKLIAYAEEEKKDGKSRGKKDRKLLHRGHITQKPVTGQEDVRRVEVPEEIPFYQPDQGKEDLLFT